MNLAKIAAIIRQPSESAKTFDKLRPSAGKAGPGARYQYNATRAAGKFFANPIVVTFFRRIKPDGNFEMCCPTIPRKFCR